MVYSINEIIEKNKKNILKKHKISKISPIPFKF
jgi:hypothetical protein